jgi:hypothetical protein
MQFGSEWWPTCKFLCFKIPGKTQFYISFMSGTDGEWAVSSTTLQVLMTNISSLASDANEKNENVYSDKVIGEGAGFEKDKRLRRNPNRCKRIR